MTKQGQLLKNAIKGTGKTQEEAAILLGMTRQNLGLYFLKDELPDDILQNAKKKLGIDLTNQSGIFQRLDPTELFKPIPFFNINVSAGDVVFLDDGLLKGIEPDDWMYIPKNIDADIAFPTFGHSMYPEISNGDRVAYKFLKDWSFFNYGMKYLIVTAEQRMVKYIKKHDKQGFLKLESRNADYEPIDMPIKSIRFILQVRYIGKIEM